MKKRIKTIGLCVGAFIAGVVLTLLIIWVFILPDAMMDFSMLANEGAINSYIAGYNDGENGTNNFDKWFDEDLIEALKNYDYKYIKEESSIK